MIVKTLLFLNLKKAFNSLNFKKFIKPIVLFISIILIISTLSFLAATVVQSESENNKTISIYVVNTNSSTPIPIPTPTTRPTPDSTRTFIPIRIIPLILDQTQNPTVMPTPMPPLSPTPTPKSTVVLTPTFTITQASTPYTTIIPQPTATPTPYPTTIPLATLSPNLETYSNDWGGYSRGYGIIFSSVLPPSQPQITALDYGVLYNGQPSIRIDRYVSGSENIAREVDGNWLRISPGDHIVFTCWMKTSPSGLGYNGVAGYGARIGFSYYDTKFIRDIQYTGSYTINPTHQQIIDNFVPWNTASWTLKTLDCIVPSTVYDYNGVAHTPTGIIPWMQATTITDTGSAWFAEPTLYVNN